MTGLDFYTTEQSTYPPTPYGSADDLELSEVFESDPVTSVYVDHATAQITSSYVYSAGRAPSNDTRPLTSVYLQPPGTGADTARGRARTGSRSSTAPLPYSPYTGTLAYPISGEDPPADTSPHPSVAAPTTPMWKAATPQRRAPFGLGQHRAAGQTSLANQCEAMDRDNNVKYIREAVMRHQYQVMIGSRLRRRGLLLDTKEIKQHFISKHDINYFGMAHLGPKDKTAKQPINLREKNREWFHSCLIWVCAKSPQNRIVFYSHIGKLCKFHHSTFMAGGNVICAGEWIVKSGELLRISANSGHYRPPLSALIWAVRYLTPAITSNTTVLLYHRGNNKWDDVKAMDFLSHPTGRDGRYSVHPDSRE